MIGILRELYLVLKQVFQFPNEPSNEPIPQMNSSLKNQIVMFIAKFVCSFFSFREVNFTDRNFVSNEPLMNL